MYQIKYSNFPIDTVYNTEFETMAQAEQSLDILREANPIQGKYMTIIDSPNECPDCGIDGEHHPDCIGNE